VYEENFLHFYPSIIGGGMDQQNLIGNNNKSMTIGDWLITFLIQCIPLVGFIMMFVWAFGDGTNPSKKAWAQASLIFALIMVVIVIIFFILFFSMIVSLLGGMSQSRFS
jgi:Na+/phosphate symporter